MSFIFKTSSLEFSPLSICIKQDVLTDNKPSVFKDFMFWGLRIPDSAKQGYVSDLFLHKQLETCRKLTLDFVYLDGKHDYVTCSNCLQIERIPYWSIFSISFCQIERHMASKRTVAVFAEFGKCVYITYIDKIKAGLC